MPVAASRLDKLMVPLLLSHIEVPACALSVAPLLLVTGSALPLLPMDRAADRVRLPVPMPML